MATAFEAFLAVEEANYQRLAQIFVAELEGMPGGRTISQDHYEARMLYLETALKKGYAIDNMEHIANQNARDLHMMAYAMPDKLSEDAQKKMMEAAKKRDHQAEWPEIFPAGVETVYLPLVREAKSVDDQLADYIQRHNAQVPLNVAKATEEANKVPDEAQRQRELGKVGRHISQQEIRISPEDGSLLQVFEARKNEWQNGPKLGGFLEKNFEWGLLANFQLERSRQPTEGAEKDEPVQHKFASLKEFVCRGTPTWHAGKVAADQYDPDSLMIVISKNPLLIGEMSTKQHWVSCMSEGREHFHYAFGDISEGSLVAYVVSQDDKNARYPLMRLLLKPYVNEDGGVILAPGKIYGGGAAGNSWTRDAFVTTVNSFLRETVNAEKKGHFTMAAALYRDGQSGNVVLGEEWTPAMVEKSLRDFFDSSLQEWGTELQDREKRIPRETGDAKALARLKAEASKYRRQIKNLRDPTALAKMFYHQKGKESIGSAPSAKVCYDIANKPEITERQAIIHDACCKGEFVRFAGVFKSMSFQDKKGIIGVIDSILPEDKKQVFATFLFLNSHLTKDNEEKEYLLLSAADNVKRSSLDAYLIANNLYDSYLNNMHKRQHTLGTICFIGPFKNELDRKAITSQEAEDACDNAASSFSEYSGMPPHAVVMETVDNLCKEIEKLPSAQRQIYFLTQFGKDLPKRLKADVVVNDRLIDEILKRAESFDGQGDVVQACLQAAAFIRPGSTMDDRVASQLSTMEQVLDPSSRMKLIDRHVLSDEFGGGTATASVLARQLMAGVNDPLNEMTLSDRMQSAGRGVYLSNFDPEVCHQASGHFYNYAATVAPGEDRIASFLTAGVFVKPDAKEASVFTDACLNELRQMPTDESRYILLKDLRSDLTKMNLPKTLLSTAIDKIIADGGRMPNDMGSTPKSIVPFQTQPRSSRHRPSL